ncbi:MAG: hypothetical protein KDE59_02780 [Anaerolineales bacterium]|nr:hypothetical protein [Anaerolineales bacterium]
MDEFDNRQLNWQQVVDSYTEFLVEQADETISRTRMRELQRVLKTNQLSNLLSVAMGTESVAAISNWIEYQMGRRDMQRAWQDTGLGEDILKRIRALKEEAQKAARRIYGQEPTREQVGAIHVAMVRQYIGYLRRWFVARGGQG